MNILICTPGRLLQHMDETPEFDASNIQILVLDEADRILDLVKALSQGTAKIISTLLQLHSKPLPFIWKQRQEIERLLQV